MAVKNGDNGNNLLIGENGDDTLNGNGGNDTLLTKAGNDIANGGDDNDILKGDAGNDILTGNRGSDKMYGGSDNDRMIWNNGDGSDWMNGGSGIDVVEVNDASTAPDSFVLGAQGSNAIFDRLNLVPFKLTVKGAEQFEINGTGGDDQLIVNDLTGTGVQSVKFSGGRDNDKLDATNTNVQVFGFGGEGNDSLKGGLAADRLEGGGGDDVIVGNKGGDIMIGKVGNDRLIWNNGDGSDTMLGGSGTDTIEVNGSVTDGDNFVLNAQGGNAIFDRLNLVPFKLTVNDAEQFEVNGGGGDDRLEVNDLSRTDVLSVKFTGGDGVDTFDGTDTTTALNVSGDAGNDTLIGGAASDLLVGGIGQDSMTGGGGSDKFGYNGDPFANGVPTATPNGIKVLNTPDFVKDYTIGQDQFVIDGSDFNISAIKFQRAASTQLTGDSNVIVLTDTFANAAAAAKAIDNSSITAKEGLFVYFNTTLGISRLVYSQDLGNGGSISVLSNLENQSGQTGINNLATFSTNDFSLA